MSDEDLEVLVTLDDPRVDALEEDTFDHFQTGNTAAPATREATGPAN